MVAHEIFAAISLAIIGVIFVSALSPNAKTGDVIGKSFEGFNNTLAAISAPVGH
jgi:hypothetical protein